MKWNSLKYCLIVTFLDHNGILKQVAKNVALKHNTSSLVVKLDAVFCLFRYGIVFTEYQAYDFYARSRSNRKTFVSVVWLSEQFERYNPRKYRPSFHDKRKFNELFSDCLNRDYMSVNDFILDQEKLRNFIEVHKTVVLKKSTGCSGKQVYVSKSSDTVEILLNMIKTDEYDLIEEGISNIKSINVFNPTSVNTIRIVTVRSDEYFSIICAVLRIGAKGSSVDNVTCGGTSARINLETHKLETVFFANDYRKNENSQIGRNEIGFEIPYWNELVELVKCASLRIPQIHIVGWDVAITENGPCLIEGNEAFGPSVMQYYASTSETGLKNRFKDAISNIK